ncbi:MAG: alpha-2-macroglobulin family protein [Candidatus Tyrphobacter sp.]
MSARSASNDDLDVRFLAHLFGELVTVVGAAKAATRRRRTFGAMFIHWANVTRSRLAALPRRPAIAPPSKGEPLMPAARTLAAMLLASLFVAPASAARPIVDLHKLDAYFALFAADSNASWKATTVRLDTYSSAPVDFSVYRVDPADVLTAGSNARPRAIDTRRLRPLMRFRFTPPGGYQFQPNAVDVPLGTREGFFVIEARRGAVGEQVWINRSRIGLIAKQTPEQLFLYGTDLGSGAALARMRVQLLVGDRFVTRYTDRDGTIAWRSSNRPIFALAQWGASFAFLSLLPQAPLPSSVIGVRTASAVVHAGGSVRVVGFARVRRGSVLVPATGDVTISLRAGARLLAEQRAAVDRAGAFTADLDVPANAAAGDDAILAQAAGGVGGASVHVDADAGGLILDVASACGDECNPSADVPVVIRSSRPDTPVHVTVIRSPHVYVDYASRSTPWGTTAWLDERITTDGSGRAEIRIAHPTDALGSTYGVRVESGGATADTRIIVATAPTALRLQLDRDQETLGTPIGFDVYATDVRSGRPVGGGNVVVTLAHGGSVQEQTLSLDAAGRARGAFTSADLGTNLVTATLDRGGARAEDATQVEVDAQAVLGAAQSDSADVSLTLDRDRYTPGTAVRVEAVAPGARGDALFSLDGAFGVQAVVANVRDGRASAVLHAVDAAGALQVSVSFVRDGAIESSASPLDVDGQGRAGTAALTIDPAPQPGSEVAVSLRGVRPFAGTVVVRVSSGDPTGSALFTSAPDALAFDVSTTQTSAPQSTTWHPWVDSTGTHPLVLEFVRHTEPPPDLMLAQADTRPVSWSVEHSVGGLARVQLPSVAGRYTLSVLAITDDGRVIAASSTIDIR